jgi:hypothetical protein
MGKHHLARLHRELPRQPDARKLYGHKYCGFFSFPVLQQGEFEQSRGHLRTPVLLRDSTLPQCFCCFLFDFHFLALVVAREPAGSRQARRASTNDDAIHALP